MITAALAIALGTVPAVARGDVGYQDQSFSGTGTPTGTKRAESVLWFNDGSWWANMWDTVSTGFHIFRLDAATQRWVDTGVAVDGRSNTHADVLWDGSKLYVASHEFVSDEEAARSGPPSYLFRYSYDPLTRSYSRDTGFPVVINNYATETLVIDKDSTGKLWATWQQANRIYMNRTVGDDRTWGTPFALTMTGSSVTVDDASAVLAFGGNQIGVLWSNQSGTNDAMYFAVHEDGQPDATWSASRTAIQGSGSADDHMNIKSLQADGSGRVYAAVKTSFSSSSAPLIMLLVRDPATGDWQSHSIARVSDCPNRPIVVIDEENRVLHAYATYPGPPGYSCNSSGGAIYEKTSPLDPISFPSGSGTPVMLDSDSPYVHNVSSSKQNVTSATGIALLAVNSRTGRYWHSFQPLGPSQPQVAPIAGFSGTPTGGSAPLAVTFTDTSTGAPTSWSWDFGDGTTSTARNPSHTYAAGTYTVRLTVANEAGADTETKTSYITATPPPAPTADFSLTPASGIVPLSVTFTDTSGGNPTTWSWSFGDGTTSTVQNPTHVYTSAGSYTVALTVSNASGSDTATRADAVVAQPPPPDFTLSAAPSSRTLVRGAATAYAVTVTPTGGYTGSVDLDVSGLPAGATGSFSPDPVAVTVAATSTLNVAVPATAKPGHYDLTITGSDGGLVHTTVVALQVKRK